MSLTVLIIDDDSAFRRMIEIRLRNWREDLEVTHAETLKEARTILDNAEKPFPLVVLDQNLPDGMGSEIVDHPGLEESTVLAVSSDDAPELPGKTVQAGAQHFLHKRQVSEPLFIPLLEALLQRKKLERELLSTKIRQSRMETIRTLLATLRHEINNPLGAVLGGAYILRSSGTLSRGEKETLLLIEASGNRIKHVLSQLCETAELETVTKAQEELFHVPGDKPWEDK